MIRIVGLIRGAHRAEAGDPAPFDIAVLAHDERHLRRKLLGLAGGDRVMVDFAETTRLHGRDLLVMEDGRHAEIVAAEEALYAVRPRDALHLAELCWHIGNRHLAARVEAGRILILRDHVIRAMLEGLGARVEEVVEPFEPLRGAYSGHHHHAGAEAHHARHN